MSRDRKNTVSMDERKKLKRRYFKGILDTHENSGTK